MKANERASYFQIFFLLIALAFQVYILFLSYENYKRAKKFNEELREHYKSWK